MNEGAGPTFDEPGYDVIGDVHGHVDQLQKLLTKLGYSTREGDDVYRHPRRTVVFVGDLIDYNPEATDGTTDQLATIRLVKAMVDGGSARIVIGNHEFNAVAYATVDRQTLDYCRPHSRRTSGSTRNSSPRSGSARRSTERSSTGSRRSRCGSTSVVCV